MVNPETGKRGSAPDLKRGNGVLPQPRNGKRGNGCRGLIPQQAGPSADARIGGEGEWGKGARGAGRARGRCTSRRDARGWERRWGYALHLRPISSSFSNFPRSWSGSRRRDSGPEAGGRQSVEDCGRNRGFCSQHLQVCNAYITGSPSPAVQATSRAQFMHTSHRTLHAGAKGGWVHVRAAGGAAHRGLRTPGGRRVCSAGARSPSSAGTPFAVTGGHLALF